MPRATIGSRDILEARVFERADGILGASEVGVDRDRRVSLILGQ
jgi:hypothetical protein